MHLFHLRRETKWSTCTLTGQPLADPIAADYLGSLYNRHATHVHPALIEHNCARPECHLLHMRREAVLEFLLARSGSFADEEAQVRDPCMHACMQLPQSMH